VPGCYGRQVGGPVQQRLAAQSAGDVAGFAQSACGGAGVVQAGEVPGVVEQAVGQVVGGGLLAQAADRRGKGVGGVRAARRARARSRSARSIGAKCPVG